MSFFNRLKQGLGKSASKLTGGIAAAIVRKKLDQQTLDEIEDTLIMADLGVDAAAKLIEHLKKNRFDGEITAEAINDVLADGIAEILSPVAKPLIPDDMRKPFVVLLVGVNGSGKTTTAAKLAEYWRSEGRSVMLAAADTFRAAAISQLKLWSERVGAEIIAGEPGGDAAAIAYKALETATTKNTDILIIDTAGRLQTRRELMDELAKIHRVLGKIDADAPHSTVLVLDGTVGQNALSQVKAFDEATPLTGLIVTKLDGSAKGGVVVALAKDTVLPIHAVGVGETAGDLRHFDARDFAKALIAVDVS